ncbi:MAG: response regulator [Anaerolineaceae bacterium]|nr:response regulator [Anaerolineaceae bacterium]
MPSLPRVITVDPTQNISRIVRSATDLLGISIIQVDTPTGADALEELRHSDANLIIMNWELDDEIQGLILALEVKQIAPQTAVLILATEDDPETVDEETDGEPPFVYLRRPVDIHQLLRVFIAGLKGENIIEAARTVANNAPTVIDHGPLPPLNLQNARAIIKQMLVDVGAMAIILSARNGEVLLEDGAPGYLDRELLTKALIPTVMTTIEMSPLVGGQAQTIHFYDGDEKDVFVLSVGLHHFMCVVYDGQAGGRQFGSITRYGRRAAQDLVALLGASAFLIQPSETPQAAPTGRSTTSKRKTATTEVQKVELELAVKPDEAPSPEPEHVKLDPIQNFDLGLFDQMLDASAADDMFDLDRLAEMVNTGSGRKEISFDEAIELGVLPNLDGEGKK